VSTERVVVVDLPHCQHRPNLQSCWWNNLDLDAVTGKTIVKVGVAPLRPLNLVLPDIYPRHCQNPLRFLVFHFETTHELFSHTK